MQLAEAAVVTKIVEDTELTPNRKGDIKKVAAKVNKIMWGTKPG